MRAHWILALGLATPAFADVPKVAADIPPIHSLAAMVMEGVGTPDLLLPPGASPHEFALRPSDATTLQAADLVLWVGPNLTPWLEETTASLAPDAMSLPLFSVTGTLHLPFRDTPVFDLAKDDDHDHDHEHDHGHEHDHDHDHMDEDPHAWLDPVNAGVWLNVIAETLSDLDPDNAEAYRSNAENAQAKLEDLSAEISTELTAAGEISFVVYHDAYQYFENRFGVQTSGAISITDATSPGAARVDALRDMVAEEDINCVFAEPQFNPTLINAVFEAAEVRVGVIDPVGSMLDPGPGLYPQLLSDMAQSLAACGEN